MAQRTRIIGVPMDLGQSRRGVDMGPSALRVAGLQSRIKQLNYIVEDVGNIPVRQAEELERFEHGLPFLATTASVSPFVGLFGTVWGIMQSFHAIGQGSGASLAIVGPGIADALIATAVGLAAAIPAVVAYNHYVHRLHRMEAEMESFAEDLVQLFEAYFANEVPAPRGGHRTPLTR